MLNTSLKPIHPFAARMAPEIAFESLKGLKKDSTVLDPMVGSGTVLRTVSECGYNGIGFDIDPLAVLMSKVWTKPFNSEIIKSLSEEILEEVNELNAKNICLPWIDNDKPTETFINFWFGKKQISSLRKLSFVINGKSGFIKMMSHFDDEESRQNGIHVFRFTDDDIVRSGLVQFIIKKARKTV